MIKTADFVVGQVEKVEFVETPEAAVLDQRDFVLAQLEVRQFTVVGQDVVHGPDAEIYENTCDSGHNGK